MSIGAEELAILETTRDMRPEVTHRRLWEAGFRGWSWYRITEWRREFSLPPWERLDWKAEVGRAEPLGGCEKPAGATTGLQRQDAGHYGMWHGCGWHQHADVDERAHAILDHHMARCPWKEGAHT